MGWMNGEPWVPGAGNSVDPAQRWDHRHDWRRGRRSHPEVDVQGGQASQDEKAWGELRFVLSGATSINGSGQASGFLRNLDGRFSDASDTVDEINEQVAYYETFPLGDSDGSQRTADCNYGTIYDNPVEFDAYAPHVAEGIDAEARNEFLCLTSTSRGGDINLGPNTAIIHGIGLLPIDVALMGTQGMHLIWSPRSNVSLYGDTAATPLFDTLGVRIALGTDWLPSGSMNMFRELRCAQDLNQNQFNAHFSHADMWRMATLNGASAMAMDDTIGNLSTGRMGDIAIFLRDYNQSPHQAIVEVDVPDVILVLRGGQPLTGNANVVDALETGCDVLDVCGESKRVCTTRELGMDLAALESSVGPSAYPLFFCGDPENEPTCHPARTLDDHAHGSANLYSGISESGDSDGDGIADAQDNCPNMFNPIRPLDLDGQADADADGTGDVCDGCPLNVGTTDCPAPNLNDPDGDGVDNPLDNCPDLANSDQADSDNDDHGDVCDACPEQSNPGNAGCTVTVFQIQDVSAAGHPADGSPVQFFCAVSAVKTVSDSAKGFWCQDRAGGPHSGIFVFTSADTPMVALGDDVEIVGSYFEYNDLSEITVPTVTVLGSGAPLAPEVVNPADVANGGGLAEAYEGVLVQVNDVAVTVVNSDDPDDYDEFTVTGGLRVDDFIVDGSGTGGLLDNAYPIGTTFTSIVGVGHESYGNYKILPRTPADLVTP
jgi:hypothetical protein